MLRKCKNSKHEDSSASLLILQVQTFREQRRKLNDKQFVPFKTWKKEEANDKICAILYFTFKTKINKIVFTMNHKKKFVGVKICVFLCIRWLLECSSITNQYPLVAFICFTAFNIILHRKWTLEFTKKCSFLSQKQRYIKGQKLRLTRSSWLNCALRDDEAVYLVTMRR